MNRDGHIRLLPLQTANKIAAGEVVERPASVVKELMENAIDAGATRLEVAVTAGGRKLISVRDDGCGMTRDDALLSLERQATSKILDVADIEEIDTLGFRGEAIPSIASVSRMTLVTRRHEQDAGTRLTVVGGALQEVCETGAAPGTIVEIRDLFFNVPVRRKFLRAYQTELAHIKNVFTVHALAHPELGMVLNSDGRDLFRFSAGASLLERAAELFGRDFVGDLRPIDYAVDGFRVSGFAALPSCSRTDHSEQFVFVNHRPATAPIVQYALREAYPRMEGRKPAVILFIDLPPQEVDVNVHPTKREVRFVHPPRVRDAILQGVSRAIGTFSSLAAAPAPAPQPAPSAPAAAVPSGAGEPTRPVSGLNDLSVPQPKEPFQRPAAPSAPAPLPPPGPAAAPVGEGLNFDAALALLDDQPVQGAAGAARPWRSARLVGTLAEERYLLVETESGCVTIDPRAALERVSYERLMKGAQEKAASQALLIPETIQLSPGDAERLRENLAALRTLGFEVEDFGDDHFKVDAIPAGLSADGVPCRTLLADIAHDLAEGGGRRGAEKWREEFAAKSLCRFRGAKVILDEKGKKELVEALAAAEMPYLSPSGKPTMIFTSFNELERKFRR